MNTEAETPKLSRKMEAAKKRVAAAKAMLEKAVQHLNNVWLQEEASFDIKEKRIAAIEKEACARAQEKALAERNNIEHQRNIVLTPEVRQLIRQYVQTTAA